VQSAQNVLRTPGVVVLYELQGKTRRFVEYALIEAFEEEPAFVTENFGFYDEDVGDGCGGDDHVQVLL